MSEPTKRMFYVAMRNNGKPGARASVIAWDEEEVRLFKREYRGHEIRLVDGDEMKRLMTMD